jgi:hypothetical protein
MRGRPDLPGLVRDPRRRRRRRRLRCHVRTVRGREHSEPQTGDPSLGPRQLDQRTPLLVRGHRPRRNLEQSVQHRMQPGREPRDEMSAALQSGSRHGHNLGSIADHFRTRCRLDGEPDIARHCGPDLADAPARPSRHRCRFGSDHWWLSSSSKAGRCVGIAAHRRCRGRTGGVRACRCAGSAGAGVQMRRVGGVRACRCAGSAGCGHADAPGRRGVGVQMRRVGETTAGPRCVWPCPVSVRAHAERAPRRSP